MSYEEFIKRTIWVAECPNCADRVERTDDPPKERFCTDCQIWVPFKEVSYIGPKLVKR